MEVKRKFDEIGRVIEATGKCSCGRVLDLINERDCYDTTECDCGKLYNSSGQALLPRRMWEEQLDDDY